MTGCVARNGYGVEDCEAWGVGALFNLSCPSAVMSVVLYNRDTQVTLLPYVTLQTYRQKQTIGIRMGLGTCRVVIIDAQRHATQMLRYPTI